jgi:hypothetical protein
MTLPGRHRLAVDLGTSTTIAMMQWPDGRVRPLLFDGSPLLSSAVLLGVDGQLHTGRDAAHLGRGNPERLEPNPKRRIDDDVVLLGSAEMPVRDLLSAVLGRVVEEARRVAGALGDLTLTHPAAWGSRRRAQLFDAAEHAGLGRVHLVPEPVAAATYFAHTMLNRFAPGSRVVVYDLGAGTCDVTVLRRGPHGFDIVASDGLNDVGGLDVDAAIVAFLEAMYGRLWTDRVSRRQVWEDVRNAKEMLSRASGTVIALPAPGKEVPLGREQFNGLIGPVLRPTIALAKSLIRDTAGAAVPGASTAVVLVGGASRIPLVATLLAEATGIPPIVIEQPELVVAEGALHLAPVAGSVAEVPVPVSGGSPAGSPVWPGPATGTAAAPVSGTGGPSAPDLPVSGPGGPAVLGSGDGGPTVPISGTSGPAGPVTGGPTPAADDRSSASAASGRASAANGLAPRGGLAPARSGRRRVVTAAVVAVLLLAGVTATVLLNRKDNDGKGGANGQLTTSTNQSPGKYAAAVLPEKLCTKVSIGRLAGIYTHQAANTPTDTRSVDASVSNATCSIYRANSERYDSDRLDLLVIVIIFVDTAAAVSAQKMAFNVAQGVDPNSMVLTGIGEEAFAARTPARTPARNPYKDAAEDAFTYIAEARDGNLRLSVAGTIVKANQQLPSDEQIRQFGRDVAEVARLVLANLGSG